MKIAIEIINETGTYYDSNILKLLESKAKNINQDFENGITEFIFEDASIIVCSEGGEMKAILN